MPHRSFSALKNIIAIATAVLLSAPMLAAQDMHVLLELQRTKDDTVTQRITLLGNDIDPNSRSVDDRYALKIDGEDVTAPQDMLAALDHARRGYSYDNFTGGITSEDTQVLCSMAGPALGQTLYTRYLTYENSSITGSELRAVLSDPINCLYPERTRPNEDTALIAATRALGSLSALLDFQTQ